jgi:predicted TIM-barrel fold metal-dependent hydrolase
MASDSVAGEQVLWPETPIIDAHHHLWRVPNGTAETLEARGSVVSTALAALYRRCPRYLIEEFVEDLATGHDVRASIYSEAGAMYREDGPETMKSVGEVEFVNGVAAMAASGLYGRTRICAGIVGRVDLRIGDDLSAVLDAHVRAGGTRYRGVRQSAFFDEDASIVGAGGTPHVLCDAQFREGFKRLAGLGLSFDALVLEPQLPDVIDLARAFPNTQIVLAHVGCPVGVGRYRGRREERFAIWRGNMVLLGECPNVVVKLGGLGNPFGGFEYGEAPMASAELARLWRCYIETTIEIFGANRCMFESNFPVDLVASTYDRIWNAFKLIAAGASESEKAHLFAGTAARVYRIKV